MGPLCGAGQERDDKAVVVLGRIAVLLGQLAAWPLVIPARAAAARLRKIPARPVLWGGLLGAWPVTESLRTIGLLWHGAFPAFMEAGLVMAICTEGLLILGIRRRRAEESQQEEWRARSGGRIVAERRSVAAGDQVAATADNWVVATSCRLDLHDQAIAEYGAKLDEVLALMAGRAGVAPPSRRSGSAPVLTLIRGGAEAS